MPEAAARSRRFNVPVTEDALEDIHMAVTHFRSKDPEAKGKPTDAELGAIVATILGAWRTNDLK